jgi:hypothetical protein
MAIDETVTVYSFRVFDPDAADEPGTMRLVPYKASREVIATKFAGAEVLEGTGIDVAHDEIDHQGLYRRVATGWGDLPAH